MAAKIHELRAKLAALVEEANAAFDAVKAKADEEARELTAEERAAQDAYDVQIGSAKGDYDDEVMKNARLAMLGSSEPVPGPDPQLVVTGVRPRAMP